MLREFLITDDVADLSVAPKNQTVLVDNGTDFTPYSWNGTTWAAADAIAKDSYKNAAIEVQDEGVAALAPGEVTVLNFTGAGVTASETSPGVVEVTVPGGSGNSFGTVAVSGQSDVVADVSNDTLTLAAGSNITITTNAGTDTITIAASGGGSGLTEAQVRARAFLRC